MTKITISVLLCVLSIGFTHGMKITGSIDLELNQEMIAKDSNAVNELLGKAGGYFFSRPDSSLFFAQKALDLARRLNLTKQEILALQLSGEAYRFLGDYPKSL